MRLPSSSFLRHLLFCSALLACLCAPRALLAQDAPSIPQTGLRLWLRADQGVVTDADGNVSKWTDQSPHGHDAVQSEAAAQPRWVADRGDGRPAVRFDGTDDLLTLPDVMNAASAGEIFVVARVAAAGRYHYGLCAFGSGYGTGYYPGEYMWDDFGIPVDQSLPSPSVETLTAWHLYNSSLDSTGLSIVRFNGREQVRRTADSDLYPINSYSTPPPEGTPLFSDAPKIGQDNWWDWFPGDISEVIVFDRALAPEERIQVVGSIQQRYAMLVLPAAPRDLKVDGGYSDSVVLTWNGGVESADCFEVQRKGPGDVEFVPVGTGSTIPRFEDVAVTPGASYIYRVCAVNPAGERTAFVLSEAVVANPAPAEALPGVGLRLWLRADAGVTQNEAGRVQLWQDQSGNDVDAVGGGDAARGLFSPVFAPTGLNGRPAVRFGDSDEIRISNLLPASEAAELFIVLHKAPVDYINATRNGWEDATILGHYLEFREEDGAVTDGAGGRRDVLGRVVPYDQPFVYGVSLGNGSKVVRVDGVPRFSAAFTRFVNTASIKFGTIEMGRESYYGLQASIAEILLYRQALRPEARAQVFRYLERKYNFLPQPPVPSGLAAVPLLSGGVGLAWTAGDGTRSFFHEIQRQGPGESDFSTVAPMADQPVWTDHPTQNGTYHYRVRTVTAAGARSEYSAPVSIDYVAPTAPIPVSGLRCWLRADAGVATDGANNVVSWRDQSGSARVAAPSTPGHAPALVPDGINGRPAVRLLNAQDGGDMRSNLILGNLLDGATAGEYFVVLRNTPGMRDTQELGAFHRGHRVEYSAYGKLTDNFFTDDGADPVVIPFDPADTHVLNVSSAGEQWTCRLNGFYAFERSGTSLAMVESDAYAQLGAGSQNSSGYSGLIAEVIVYDRALTNEERTRLMDYLQRLYRYAPLPQVPSVQTEVSLAGTDVTLQWSSAGAVSVDIEREVDGSGNFEPVATALQAPEWRDRQVSAGHTYVYRVRTRNAVGELSSWLSLAPVSGVGAPAPVPLDGLRLWLNAGAGVRTVSDSGGTRVTAWRDQSGLGNDAVGPDSVPVSSLPLWTANGMNAQPAVSFESGRYLMLPSVLSGAWAGEYFVVVRQSWAGGGGSLGTLYEGHSSYYFWTTYGSQLRVFSDNFLSSTEFTVASGIDPATCHLYDIAAKEGEWTARINGLVVRQETNFDLAPAPDYASTHSFGALNGAIAEVLSYDRVLTDTERQRVHAYLQARYALFPVPPAPVSLTWHQSLADGAVVLDWNGGDSGECRFDLQRMGGSETSFTTIASGLAVPGYRDMTAQLGQTYTYRVVARNCMGAESAPGGTVVVSPVAVTAPVPTTGMLMWLRADLGVMTSGTGSAARIDFWRDQSGHGRDAVADVPRNGVCRPSLVANAINGTLAAVRFSEDYARLSLPDAYRGARSGECVVVHKRGSSYASSFGSFHAGHYSNYSRSTNIWSDNFLSTTSHSFAASVDLATWHIADFVSQEGEWTARLNGVVQLVDSANAVFAPGAASLGANYLTALNGGSIAEVIFYDHVLSEAERSTLLQYLNARYSVIPAPVALAAPSVEQTLANGAVVVSWAPSSTGGVTYEVERQAEGETGFTPLARGLAGTSFTDVSALVGQTYTYRVLVRNGLGIASDPSAGTVRLVEPAAPGVPVAGLKLWLRADKGLSTTVNGTTTSVTAWRDQSGAGRDALLPFGAGAPTLVADWKNGQPAVVFAGASQYLSLPTPLAGATQGEALLVLRTQSSTSNGFVLRWSQNSSLIYGWNDYGQHSTLIEDGFFRSGAQSFSRTTAVEVPHVYDVSAREGEWLARFNGVVASSALGSASGVVAPGQNPGAGQLGGGFSGSIAEVLVFDRVLTEEERIQLNQYLSQRYAVIPAPVVPVGVTIHRALVGGAVSLDWKLPATLTGAFEVERRVEGEPDFTIVASGLTMNNWRDSAPPEGAGCEYRIRCRNAVGVVSDPSAVVSLPPAVEPPPVPSAGLRLWLRSDCGVVLGANDGANEIVAWRDQSGHRFDATQNGLDARGYRPLWASDGPGGLPVVRFDSTNDYLSLPDILESGRPAEAFYVLKKNSANSRRTLGRLSSGSSSYYPYDDGSILDYFLSGSERRVEAITPITAYHLYDVAAGAGEWTARLNGLVAFTSAQNTVPESTSRGYCRIGATGSYSSDSFDGDLAELIVFDRILTPAERASVQDYLQSRYDLIPDPATPVALSATTLLTKPEVCVAWQAGAAGQAVVFELQRRSEGSSDFTSVGGAQQGNTFTDRDVVAGRTYHYRVRAIDGLGRESAFSTEATVTIETPVALVPANGIAVWLRADRGVVAGLDGHVSLWLDQSGHGHDAVALTGTGAYATVVPDAANGSPSVIFTGSTGFRFPEAFSEMVAGDAFVFLKKNTPLRSASLFSSSWSYSESYPSDAATGTIEEWFGTSSAYTFTASVPLTDYHLYNVSAGSSWVARFNGAECYRKGDPAQPSFAHFEGLGVRSGQVGSSGAPSLDGEVAEVLIYSRVLTDAERRSVEAYFSDRYVQLTAPPTLAPAAGIFSAPVTVSISAAEGAEIYCTTDGTTPVAAPEYRYSGPVLLGQSARISAIAVVNGKASASVSGLYSIGIPPASETPASGFLATYFSNPDFTGTSYKQLERTIDYSYYAARPFAGTASACWTGTLVPRFSETHTFRVEASGAVRLWLGDTLVIDAAAGAGAAARTGTIALQAGQQVPLRLEYVLRNPGSTYMEPLSLRWSGLSFSEGVIPARQVRSGLPYVSVAATPVASPAGHHFTDNVGVSLSCGAPSSARICYTVDGTEPTATSPLYTGPLSLDRTVTLRAKSFAPGYTESGTRVETYVLDNDPPVLSALVFNGGTVPAQLGTSGLFGVNATDASGIARVEFRLGATVLGVDSFAADGFTAPFSIDNTPDGATTLTVQAWDTLGLPSNPLVVQLEVLQPPPPAPVISVPADGAKQSRAEVTVRGRAQARSVVSIHRGGLVLGSGPADATGAFAINIVLESGANVLTATAKNRNPVPSAASASVTVTYDNRTPAPPLAVSARMRKAGAIDLSWQAPAGGVYTGFYVFRSTSPIPADATLDPKNAIGGGMVRTFSLSDTPAEDGRYYYRVITGYQVGQDLALSTASNQADALSDRTAPTATVRLEPLSGAFDAVYRRFGRGMANVIVTTSEPLSAPPFLNFAISGGAPVFVDLNAAGAETYTGVLQIGAQTASGTLTPLFSALDKAGNRGAQATLTEPAAIDVQGPVVTGVMPVRPGQDGALEELPLYTAIKNAPTPLTVHWRFTLDEAPKPGTTPAVTAILSSQPTTPLSATVADAGDTDPSTWLVSLTLPATAGATPEMLGLACSAADDLDNTGTKIVPPHDFQVYQISLPPLAVPSGFAAEPRPAGEIALSWQPVAGAAGYVLQVKGPTAVDFTDLVMPAATDTTYTYTPATDGTYRYRLASLRYENGTDATSSWCSEVSARADRVAPHAPTALAPTVVAEGVAVTWQAPAVAPEDVEGYALYRSATAITAENIGALEPIVVSIPKTATVALDPHPVPTQPHYALVAFDDAGNRSAPAPAYVNVSLLPVGSIAVSVLDSAAPQLDWQPAPGSVLDGFRLAIDGQPVELAGSTLFPPAARNYVDAAYAGGSRRYTVTCVSGPDTKERSLTLPALELALAEGARITKGLPGTLQLLVRNLSAEPLARAQLQVLLDGKVHLSSRFTLAAGEQRSVPVVVGGYEALPSDQAPLQAKVLCEPQTGAGISVARSLTAPVSAGAVTVELLPVSFTRGGNGKVRFRLTNPSDLDIDIKVARHGGEQASDQVRLILTGLDGAVLSTADVRIPLGDGIVGLPNGDTVLRVPHNDSLTSPELTIPVPLSAPPTVSLGLAIDSLYYAYGDAAQVQLPGPSAHLEVSTRETAYFAQIDAITPSVAYSRQPITIRGRAFWRPAAEGLPAAVAPTVKVNVAVEIRGFIRTESVTTDTLGNFEYVFLPGRDESGGLYQVWASHPDLVFRPDNPATFAIGNVIVSPHVFSVRVPRNYRYEIPIQATAGAGATITNLRAVSTGSLPAGVSVTTGVIASVAPNQTVTLPLSILGRTDDPSAVDTGSVRFEVVSDGPEGATLHWADLEVPYVFSNPKPILQATPNPLWIGVQEGQIAAETVTLKNQGFAALENATVSIVPQSGVLKPWIRLQTSSALGPIDVGGSVAVTVTAAPPETGSLVDNQLCLLRVQGTNVPTVFDFPFTVTVKPKGDAKGSIDLHVTDPYFGLTLADGAVNPAVDGLPAAHVSLEKETVLNEPAFSTGGVTDARGAYSAEDLPAGYYKLRITADKHEPYLARIAIRPGVAYQDTVSLAYNPVTFSWEVVPITFQDRYNIVLHATYETNVPVPVVVVEPGFITVQPMCAGQVQNGELRVTNHGLIRAENVKVNMPANTEFFAFETLVTIGDTLEAGESVKVPYRVRCLKAFGEDCPAVPAEAIASQSAPAAAAALPGTAAAVAASAPGAMNAGGSGGCWSVCATVPYSYPCANGGSYTAYATYCVGGGKCGGGSGVGGGGLGGGGWGGGGVGGGGYGGPGGKGSVSGYDDDCAPDPDSGSGGGGGGGDGPGCNPSPGPDEGPEKCPPKDDGGNSSCGGRSAPAGSWVDLPTRQYRDSVTDLSVPVRDGKVTASRVFDRRRWSIHVGDSIFAACTYISLKTEQWALVLNGRQYYGLARHDISGATPRALGTYEADAAPAGRYRYGTDNTDVVEKLADGTFVWTNGTDARRTYDSRGRLVQRFYQNRLVATYHYDATSGLLATVSDFSGRTVLTCAYTAGRLTAVSDVAGRTVGYGYDSEGRLQTVTAADGSVTTMAYDDWWHLTGKRVHRPGQPAASDMVETIIYRLLPTTEKPSAPPERIVPGLNSLGDVRRGFVTRVTFNTGRVHDFYYRYDSGSQQYYTKQVFADGGEEEKIFDRSGVLMQTLVNGETTERIEQDERMRVTTRGGQRTIEEFDDLGHLARRTEADGAITQYVNDPASGRVLRTTDPLGVVTAYTYDTMGNRLTVTEAVGTALERTTTTTYVPGTDWPLLRTRADGSQTQYEYFDDGTLKREYDPLHPQVQTTYTYDALRRMLTATDALGRTTRYEYDATGHQTKVTNPLGEETISTYDGDLLVAVETGRVVTATETKPGRIVRFSYDAEGHRTEERRVLDESSERVVTTLTYDARGQLVGTTNALGQTQSSVYDSAGNRVAVQVPNSLGGLAETRSKFDAQGRPVETVDPAGARTAIEYDSRGRVVFVTEAVDTLVERYTKTRFDLLGRTVETTQWDLQHPAERFSTTYEYDLLGRRTAVGGNRAYPTQTIYDAANRPLTVTDALGQVHSYEYEDGRLVREKQNGVLVASYAYDLIGNRLSATDATGNHRHFRYDALDRMTHESIPLAASETLPANWWELPAKVLRSVTYTRFGETESVAAYTVVDGKTRTAITTSTYNALGQKIAETSSSAVDGVAGTSLTVTFDYDLAGNLIRTNYPAVPSSGATAGTAETIVRSQYNAALVESVVDRTGAVTRYSYDAALRPVESTSAFGGITRRSYDALGRVAEERQYIDPAVAASDLGFVLPPTSAGVLSTRTTYNLFGQPVQVIHPDHVPGTQERIETFVYDSRGKLVTKGGAGGYPITYAYDDIGRLHTLTDGNSHTTTWTYAPLAAGTPAQLTKTYADGKSFRYTLDAAGRMVSRLDARGRTTGYAYNAYGLLTGIDYPNDPDVSFAYDQQGRRLSMTDGSGSTEWTYDALGLTASETQSRARRQLAFGYDGFGQRTSLAVSALDDAGDPVGAPWTTTYGYDNTGRLQTVLDDRLPSGQPYRYTYAAAKPWLAQIALPGGLVTTRMPDAFGRLLSTATKRGDATVVDSFAYSYDRADQRSLETTPETTRTFGYDQYRQLTSAVTGPEVSPALALTYDFDSIGNRLATSRQSSSEALAKEAYATNSVNQYTSITGAVADAPEYDDNGNTTATGGLALTWDDENRLVSSTNGVTTTTYVYDGIGRRVEKSEYESGILKTTSRYAYDGWRVVEELRASGASSAFALARSYTRGTDISGTFEGAGGIGSMLALTAPVTADGQPATALQSASYVYDGNGNVTALVADDGTVRASYRYDPFGQRLAATGSWADLNPYQFSSKERDASTGYYYYGYRYYASHLGRWLGRDPLAELGSANLYACIENSLVTRLDHLGLESRRVDESSRGRRSERRNDEGRRGRGRGLGGDFQSDWAGRAILDRWLSGGGNWVLFDDPDWSRYMMDDESLRSQSAAEIGIEAARLMRQYGGNAFSEYVSLIREAEFENGEGVIGYQYLHHTNGSVGGYAIRGTIDYSPSDCRITFNMSYTWNDMIDPNPDYTTDSMKSIIGEIITFGRAESYRITITWHAKAVRYLRNSKPAEGWPLVREGR